MTLRRLNLQLTVMAPAMWTQIVHLTKSASLLVGDWNENLTPEQWAPLVSFAHLTALSITPCVEGGRFESAHYLPALVQCSTLEHLLLFETELTSAQMELLTRSLHRLGFLVLSRVRLPLASLSFLSLLPTLWYLDLDCLPLNGPVEDVRPYVHALLRVSTLCISDPQEHGWTAEQVTEQNTALLARCPMLQPSNFTYDSR